MGKNVSNEMFIPHPCGPRPVFVGILIFFTFVMTAATTPEVQGVGYSPGAFQGRIVCLLNDCPRLQILKLIDGTHHDGCRVLSKKTPS